MNCFIVAFGENNAGCTQAIARAFPHNRQIVPERVWVVASRVRACSDICQTIGMSADGGRTSVVVRFEDYNGFLICRSGEKSASGSSPPSTPSCLTKTKMLFRLGLQPNMVEARGKWIR